MASWQVRQKDPLLDQGTQAMLERRGRELIGLALLAVGLLFAVMLGSYSAEDPGWMVSTQEPARNMLGRFGASVSSTLIILIGRGAWALPLIFGAWGLRFILHRGAERVLGRAIFGVIAVAVAAAFASTLPVPQSWTHGFGLGGLFGDTVAGALLGLAGQSGFGLTLISFATFLGLLAILTYVTGFDRAELVAISNRLRYGSAMGLNSVLGTAAKGAATAAQSARAGAKAMAERRQSAADYRRQAELPLRGGASLRPQDQPLIEDTFEEEAYQPAPLAAPSRKVVRRAPLVAEPPLRAEPTYPAAEYEDYPQYEEPQYDARPAPLTMQQGYSAPASLRAEPRYFEPEPQAYEPLEPYYAPEPVKEKQGFFSRILRGAEPDQAPLPELVEPMLSASAMDAQAPHADRIKARISDVVRTRASGGKPMRSNPNMTPLQAAIAARRAEPPVMRPRGPKPLIADTRPNSLPPNAMRVAEPPLSALRQEEAYPDYAPDYAAYADPYAGYEPDLEPLPYEEMLAAPPQAPAPRYIEPQMTANLAEGLDDFDEGPINLFADEEDDWAPRRPLAAPAPRVMAPPPAPVHSYDEEEDEDEAYLPTPPVSRAAPQPERRAVVQPPLRKPIQPSQRAKAEAQPALRFEPVQGPDYELPPLALLSAPTGESGQQLSDEALEENARMLESVLDDYGVKGEIVSVRPGPVVTMYELEPAPGLKASRVIGLADDIARSMSALSARVSTVPGRTVIGIELPNNFREKVFLREILAAREFGDGQQRLPLALGKDIGGDPVVANLAKMPHLLIAGTTGSGKSVAINTMILSLLYKLTPEECRMIMIDPKMLELSVYDGIPHLLSPVVTDPKKAVVALKWVVGEMEERYRKMSKMGVRNIDGYNGRVREALATGEMFKRTIQTGFDDETGDPVFETEEFAPQPFPYIVVIVDEMADLMMVAGKEIEACIQRLAQMARASGIHLIMATQRPSVDVITGTIKANFPTRISFQVTSKIDSRTILGEQGAEQLLGQGDMLYMGNGQRITRIHGPFVSDEEVEEIVSHLKSFGPPAYMSGVVDGPDEDKADDIDAVLGLGGNSDGEDSLYDQAVAIVARDRKCSTSYIQRKLGIGYNKAARLVEQMEDEGIVTAANHVGKREILIPEQ